MADNISSSNKVQYDLRPRKQIERRMMGHAFQLFAEAGFPISTYRYVGFGAFFFVDFILFRRITGITNMVSLEYDSTRENRVKFNAPFKDIDIRIQPSTDYLASIPKDLPHIMWLDYDGPLSSEYIEDIRLAASELSTSSIVIITFDIDFDKADGVKYEDPENRKRAWCQRYKREAPDLFYPLWNDSDFTAKKILARTIEITQAALAEGISTRFDVSFEPLFNFEYADGHTMLTYGGMIASKADKLKLKGVGWSHLPFTRRSNKSVNPFVIDVPILTRKEKLLIDSAMPCEDGWSPEDFEIDLEDIDKYRQVYRYYPSYAELLL